MSTARVAKARIARFLDFDEGCLLVLTEDFQVGKGWTESVRPDFNWWVLEGAGVVGYSIDGLDDGIPDHEFLRSCDFRVVVPQFGLTDAGVDQVAEAAYDFYVRKGEGSAAGGAYAEALSCMEEARDVDGLIRTLEKWTSLYHLHGHGDGLYWMGVTCAKLGMFEKAASWLHKFLELRHDNPWAHYQLGMLYSEAGDHQLARIHLESAVFHETVNGYKTGAAALLARMDN